MMVKFVVLLTLMSVVRSTVVTTLRLQDIDKEWYIFKARFNRLYSTKAEEQYRYSVFADNFKRIYYHNKAADLGKYTYWLGVNKFADLISEEFNRIYANLKLSSKDTGRIANKKPNVNCREKMALPEQIDWRNIKNMVNRTCVTRVKDQGKFSTCYAFAAAGVLESHNCLQLGDLDILSEQNIIDCSTPKGNPLFALIYAMENGIDTEDSYPYKGKVGTCKESNGQLGAWVEDIEMIWPYGNVMRLKEAVACEGPVSVCIDTGDRNGTFHLYKNGVYNNPTCKERRKDLNHALLLVGYGVTDKGDQYWLLKNSYGIGWGEEGYMKLQRDDNYNTCGIASFAMYPIVDYYYYYHHSVV